MDLNLDSGWRRHRLIGNDQLVLWRFAPVLPYPLVNKRARRERDERTASLKEVA